jgi:hypothetical protein
MVFSTRNLYEDVVETLEASYDACSRALNATAGIPRDKGGGDIAQLAETARSCLHEALQTAALWQNAFNYHFSGNRTDF